MTYKLYKEGWYIPSFLLVIVNGMHLELMERKRKCISYIKSFSILSSLCNLKKLQYKIQ